MDGASNDKYTLEPESSLSHVPDGAWKFDASVAACFDDMLHRSIPLYEETIDLVCRLALHTLAPGDTILELGISTGNVLQHLRAIAPDHRIRYIGIDNSQAMLDKARQKVGDGAELINHDLREGLPYRAIAAKPRVVFCLWTSTFVPIEYRSALFKSIREALTHEGRSRSGCLFVADKLRGQTAEHNESMTRAYHDWKQRQGYTPESIRQKARAIEGVLVPNDAPGQKAMIQTEGFAVEEVIRYLGFAAWHCIPR